MTKLIVFAGVLAMGATLQAGTTLVVNTGGTNPDLNTASPYSGTLTPGGSGIELICDDFNDSASTGTTYNVVVTNIGSGTLNATDTRYGGATGYPAATTLYDELAWLGTQMTKGTVTGAVAANNVEIQEAIWALTDPSGHTSPTASYTGQTQTYLQWMQDAKYTVQGSASGYSGYGYGTAASYLTPTYSDWYVVTNTAAVGCTMGSGSGCAGSSYQEFIAYSAAPVVTTGGSLATPEPASFILIGSGLLAGALVGRRRRNRK